MKYNIKFMITLLVLLSSLSAVGIVQSQENGLRVSTGDTVQYSNNGDMSGIDFSTIQINDLNSSDLIEYSSQDMTMEGSYDGEINLAFAELEDLTHMPFNPMDDPDFSLPDDTYMYGISINQGVDMEFSQENEYSNYYYDAGENSTGEWWNGSDSYDDSDFMSNTFTDFAFANDDYLFMPEGPMMEMGNSSTTDHWLYSVYVYSFDMELEFNNTITMTTTTYFEGGIEYFILNITEVGTITNMAAEIPIDRAFGDDSHYVDVYVNATYTYSEEVTMKYDRTDIDGMYLGETESEYEYLEGVFWNDNVTLDGGDALDEHEYYNSAVKIAGEFGQGNYDVESISYLD